MTTVTIPVQSRHGFHPCDYATYKSLRRLNFIRLEYLRQHAKYERWARKDPQNRIIRKRMRPVLDAAGKTIPWPEPNVPPAAEARRIFRDVEENYRRARRPKPSAEAVEPLTMLPVHIDERLRDAEKWYASLKV